MSLGEKRSMASFLAVAVLALPSIASAGDTLEAFDVGFSDLELYFGYDGVGLSQRERSISGELVMGFGLIERFSAYLGTSLSAPETFEHGAGELFLGTFGTPVDTDHFDLDLGLELRLGGQGMTELQVVPGFELNFDLVPDLGLWGLYLAVGVPIGCETVLDEAGREVERTAVTIETTIGTYVTIAERHQIHLDVEVALHPMAGRAENVAELGSVGLGYNVAVHEAIELITEARVGLPSQGDEVSLGLVAGLIATLPTH